MLRVAPIVRSWYLSKRFSATRPRLNSLLDAIALRALGDRPARSRIAANSPVPELLIFVLACLIAPPAFAQTSTPRPRILGIAHVAIDTSDLPAARKFYTGVLGFEEPFALTYSNASGSIAFIKVNDQQYLELYSRSPQDARHLSHFALVTDDAAAMKSFLVSRGVNIVGVLHKGNTGNLFFSVRDPDGHLIEFVQYEPGSWTDNDRGAHMPVARISNRIARIGLRAGAPNPTLKFYKDILGFEELRRGSTFDGQSPSITLRLPDSSDCVELLLYRDLPIAFQSSVQDRVYFERNDVSNLVADLKLRSARSSVPYPRAFPFASSQARGWALYDPGGTLIEIAEPPRMEYQPVQATAALSR